MGAYEYEPPVDCAGIPGGNSVCLNIDNIDSDAGSLDVLYSSNSDIAGFQFELGGIDITGATSTLGDVVTQAGSSLILGLSISDGEATGTVLPAGSGILASISLNPSTSDITSCLSDAVMAFEGGVAASNISYPQECSNIPSCSNVDDCGECGGDGSNCVGENVPDWGDCPPCYENTASMTAIVNNALIGEQMYGEGDILAAFDDSGNVRGIALLLYPIPFGPYEGTGLWEIQIRGDEAGDAIRFKYNLCHYLILHLLKHHNT
jgi:hypothetical protein